METEYKVIDREGVIHYAIRSQDELLEAIKNGYRCEFRVGVHHPVKDNEFLNQLTPSWDNLYRHYITHHWDRVHESFVWDFTRKPRDLMLIDQYGRTVNLGDMALASFDYHPPVEGSYHKRIKGDWGNDHWMKGNWRWELSQKRNRHSEYSHYYRQKSTQQERREASNPENIPYIRPKRRPTYLDPYELERRGCREFGWKQVRIKKQYLEKVLDSR